MYFFIILILCVTLAAYLNNALYLSSAGYFENDSVDMNAVSAMRFLTRQTTRVKKNYENPPNGYKPSLFNTQSVVRKDRVQLTYPFPLVGKEKSILNIDFEPTSVSMVVDRFGVQSSLIERTKDGVQFLLRPESKQHIQFLSELREGSWMLTDDGQVEVDYLKLVEDSHGLSKPIALHIAKELKRIGKDDYYNRVQATLNFVQFLPYGQPDFDIDDFFFLGVSLIQESLVLNYSDCDSKSLLFATVLSHLIDPQNMVFVVCDVGEEDGELERHMMVGVKGLENIEGCSVNYQGSEFLLLETTSPSEIGSWDWAIYAMHSIIPLSKDYTQL